MKKIKKYKKTILIVILAPFVMLFINRIIALYYDQTYFDIDKGIESGKYEMKKIKISGYLNYCGSDDHLIPKYDADGILELIDSNNAYQGHVYLDTIHLNFIIDIKEHISGSEINDDLVQSDNYVVIDKKGQIIQRIVIDSLTYNLKNCLLLENKIDKVQYTSMPPVITMKHFLKKSFTPCFIPKMTLGISNVNGICYTWSGTAYWELIAKNEKFKFTFEDELQDLFSYDWFFVSKLGYYEIPKKYEDLFDISFFVKKNDLYIIKRKGPYKD
ncbi:hypothetical protein [Flavobacterium hercynium]|uniref:Uncharacterized protein n=1 Tax=Flavobacterium hercynium TaxID=387094 RepID=A0A226GZ86_9FLAO|nr:hypothetical protein [Flavobacterium hercynium]OXA86888.1 hypothetical protein B0A66_17110 [Flavobacterium hercynium]SMP13130.1 hypothetical protein SAMN06265346_103302 [Flavobacterium hercynium]